MKQTPVSVRARDRLLARLLEGKATIPPTVATACRSQGGLAKLHLAAEGITPLSLNALKTTANAILEGGWPKLNEMRKQVVVLTETRGIRDGRRKVSAGITSRPAKGADAQSDSEALSAERHYRLRLEAAYHDLLVELRKLAQSSPALMHTLNRYVAAYSFKRLTVIPGGRDA